MGEDFIAQITNEALLLTLIVSGPPVLASTFVGLMIALFQAVTQIQEQSLTFVPKIVATVLALIFFGPWMLRLLMSFTIQLYARLPELAR